MTWLETDPGWVASTLSGALLGHYLAVEPWWGRSMFARLKRLRPHDPPGPTRNWSAVCCTAG